ncbi:helix-turn-helix transcriptional regulator [Gymnodinialimonas sp. 2305UL16-5]|uniref:helix-turn-helix domain-containing protein n=1 Tax=Gymnodinialimonas mytili TaxID=3126503 RepID=UPI0030A9D78C
MARAALRLGVRELAALSGVSFTTISRFETGRGGLQRSTAQAIQNALEEAGIRFLDAGDTVGGPAVEINDLQADND